MVWVLTSFDDLVGALVVFNEVEHDVSLKDRFPQFEKGSPNRAYRSVRRDHLGLDGGVRHARLLSALGAKRKTGVDANKGKGHARGGF